MSKYSSTVGLNIKSVERYVLYGLLSASLVGYGILHYVQEKKINNVRLIAEDALKFQEKPSFNLTGLRPTADGMIMDNGSINFPALFSRIVQDLHDCIADDPGKDFLPCPELSEIISDKPPTTEALSTEFTEDQKNYIRVKSGQVFQYYWGHITKISGDLPPFSVIDY